MSFNLSTFSWPCLGSHIHEFSFVMLSYPEEEEGRERSQGKSTWRVVGQSIIHEAELQCVLPTDSEKCIGWPSPILAKKGKKPFVPFMRLHKGLISIVLTWLWNTWHHFTMALRKFKTFCDALYHESNISYNAKIRVALKKIFCENKHKILRDEMNILMTRIIHVRCQINCAKLIIKV